METINLVIPKTDDPSPQNLTLKNGDQLFIVGPNGSGKSALMQHFASGNRDSKFMWITAHRQTSFNSAKNNLTFEQRQQSEANRLRYASDPRARYWDLQKKDWSAILYDLDAKENTIDKSIAQLVRDQDTSKAEKRAAESPLPFDQINELLTLGGLTVTLERAQDESIQARHPRGQPFSIIKMSDGERNATIMAGHVITAESDTVFLIDEPERHLHRAIIEPFLSALFDLRKDDCAFIISTHEVALPVANPDSQVIILRSCQWSEDECTGWDAEVVDSNSQLPEDLKREILGSRKRILFVEGDSTNSLDFPLYTSLFSDISVISKGSCEEVQKAVLGLRDSQDIHDVEAFGLIDRDNRSCENVEKLVEEGVFALKVYSAEALYYCSDAIAAVAHRQAESFGEDPNGLIESARQKAIGALRGYANRMAARRCERQIRDRFLSKVPDTESIIAESIQSFCVSIDSLYQDELKHFNKLVEGEYLDKLIARYPLRESNTFAIIASALGCRNKKDYERMVIQLIDKDNELTEKLKKRIGPLSRELNSLERQQTT